jgi:hypothetical protein
VLVLGEPGGERGRLRAPLHAELAEQGGHVVLRGLLGEEHALGDLPVGQPLADQLEDPLLLVGQRGQRVDGCHPLAEPLHHPLRRVRVQCRLPGGDRPHGAHQVRSCGLLHHVTSGASHDRAQQRLIIPVRREHQAGRAGQRGADLTAD